MILSKISCLPAFTSQRPLGIKSKLVLPTCPALAGRKRPVCTLLHPPREKWLSEVTGWPGLTSATPGLA